MPAYCCAADGGLLEPVGGDGRALACTACGYRTDTPGSGVLDDAFDVIPRQWGLRADPHLWKAMRDHLAATPTPPTREAARRLFVEAIVALADLDIDTSTDAWVARPQFDHGGMSGGMVNVGWWRTTGIPLLVERATSRRPANG